MKFSKHRNKLTNIELHLRIREIKFNPSKIVFIEFGGITGKFKHNNKIQSLIFDGNVISKSKKMKYLCMH